MATARDEVLSYGLIDWVDLGRIHWYVTEDNPDAPPTEVQNQTLSLIRSLVADGLFEVGDLSGKGGYFVRWDSSLDESMQRIHDMYVEHFEDRHFWGWACWLNLTRSGVRVALGVEGLGTPREDVLLVGLCGRVNLGRIHGYVKQDVPEAPLSDVQKETLALVQSLPSDGLFEVGDFSDKNRSFTTWESRLDASMQRMYKLYVTHFDDEPRWSREIWLKLTDKGEQVARSLEAIGGHSVG